MVGEIGNLLLPIGYAYKIGIRWLQATLSVCLCDVHFTHQTVSDSIFASRSVSAKCTSVPQRVGK
jgi:hypothetical protein